jgi:hypothetical protein
VRVTDGPATGLAIALSRLEMPHPAVARATAAARQLRPTIFFTGVLLDLRPGAGSTGLPVAKKEAGPFRT